ncbi:MAG: DNA-binding protein WhiA [Bacillota bacterium]|nr:DNA-binding protein WhiA [Bacillota bacterium]HHU62450.1 DNA-binding protein WhiA [Natronincola sp.]
MAFSDDTRNELARVIPTARCCRLTELYALYELDGFLFGSHNQYLDFNNSSPLVARKILKLVKGLYPDFPTQTLVVKSRSRRTQMCTVRILGRVSAERIYGDFKKLSVKKDSGIPRKKCCRRAYLRGAFLSRGSITNPEKTYHLEISTEQTMLADKILTIILSLGLEAGITHRKGSLVVYMKDGQQIVNLLNLMGAHGALLHFENIRVMKDMRNQINRLVNCETANVDKTVNAALKQLEHIKTLEEHIGLEELPPKLAQVARVRLENPYASLQELGELMIPKMSKSGINYRLRQIREMAQQLDNLDPKS